jgi:hypothetical protein
MGEEDVSMADKPKKTREQRLQELQRLWMTARGREEVERLFQEPTGLPEGTEPRAGTLVFQTILDKQFPKG